MLHQLIVLSAEILAVLDAYEALKFHENSSRAVEWLAIARRRQKYFKLAAEDCEFCGFVDFDPRLIEYCQIWRRQTLLKM